MNFYRSLACMLALAALLPAAILADEPPRKPATLEDVLYELRLLRQVNEAQIKSLGDEVAALRQRVTALELKTQVRTSFAPPQTGILRLENRLDRPATFLINDTTYRLQPFRTLDLPSQPAGVFTYEVLVDGAGSLSEGRTTRTLLPNQVYSIFTFQPVFTSVP